MTPGECYERLQVAAENAGDRQKLQMTAAWLSAALARQKTLPGLDRLLSGQVDCHKLVGEERERARADHEALVAQGKRRRRVSRR